MTKSTRRIQRYTWRQFDKDLTVIIRRIQRRRLRFDGVWGPPRGGLPLAVALSHALGIPFRKKPGARTLIVDDIADTGKTLKKFSGKNLIVTLFYHRRSIVVPDMWLREKRNAWIVFPWEKST